MLHTQVLRLAGRVERVADGDSLVSMGVRAVMAVPLRRNGKVIGLIYAALSKDATQLYTFVKGFGIESHDLVDFVPWFVVIERGVIRLVPFVRCRDSHFFFLGDAFILQWINQYFPC